jgi:hypothetical protein
MLSAYSKYSIPKWVLQPKNFAAQKIVYQYFSNLGGDFASMEFFLRLKRKNFALKTITYTPPTPEKYFFIFLFYKRKKE